MVFTIRMNTNKSQLRRRVESLLWRAAMMGVAAFVAFVAAHLADLDLPYTVTVILGLVFGEVSKYLNSLPVAE